MEAFTQKWSLVCLLEKKTEGYEFSAQNWPLHITISGTSFEVEWNEDRLLDSLTALVSQTPAFKATVLNYAKLGPPSSPVLVSMIESDSGLGDLHNKIVDLLLSHNAIFTRPLHIKAGYKAHATVKASNKLYEGDSVAVDNIALVDMFPRGDGHQRKVINILELK